MRRGRSSSQSRSQPSQNPTVRPAAGVCFAAVLVLADVLRQEPVIIEPDDRQTYGVKEAAELLHTSSKKVYQMCLAGKLGCVRIGGRVRIPIDEINRYDAAASTALVPGGPR